MMGTLELSTIAREVGMATLLRAGIVVVITTGRFASSVKPFVDTLNGTTTTQVFLVDGALLARYASAGPSSIADAVREFTLEVMGARRSHLDLSLERIGAEI